MTENGGLSSIRRAVSAVLAILAVMSGVVFAPAAHADPRDWLRPDATGTCDWDPALYWVQNCDVFSPAMGINVPVKIIPAARGGNAGFYLLDGAYSAVGKSDWINFGAVQKAMENTNITTVLPTGGAGSFFADWNQPTSAPFQSSKPVNFQYETFLSSELPAYLEQNFGVARNNNAIGGISMGGSGAIRIAGNHPDVFRMGLSYSGFLTLSVPGAQLGMQITMLASGGWNVNDMYGSVVSPRRFENDPLHMVDKMRNTKIYIAAGNGTPRPEDLTGGLVDVNTQVVGGTLETVSNLSTKTFAGAARAAGVDITEYYSPVGAHTWAQFVDEFFNSRDLVLGTMNAF